MLKFLVIGVLIYFAYQLFFRRPALPTRRQDEIDRMGSNGDEEFVDYEEVD